MASQGWVSWLAPLAKYSFYVVIGATWLLVGYFVADRFAGYGDDPGGSPFREVLSARAPATATPAPAAPPRPQAPVPTSMPSMATPVPPAPTAAPPAAQTPDVGPGPPLPTATPPAPPPVNTGGAGEQHPDPRALLATSAPVSASRHVPRLVVVQGAPPGTRFTVGYRSPAGVERRMVGLDGASFVLTAGSDGRSALTVVPASSFAGIAGGPWTLLVCVEGTSHCVATMLLVSDGGAEIIGRQPVRR
jgi:hypothetical protein